MTKHDSVNSSLVSRSKGEGRILYLCCQPASKRIQVLVGVTIWLLLLTWSAHLVRPVARGSLIWQEITLAVLLFFSLDLRISQFHVDGLYGRE